MIQVLCLLFVLSGAAGLIYESIWTRYLGLFVGHGAYAQVLVLVIFLGGMSAGAPRGEPAGPSGCATRCWYAYVELAVGCSASSSTTSSCGPPASPTTRSSRPWPARPRSRSPSGRSPRPDPAAVDPARRDLPADERRRAPARFPRAGPERSRCSTSRTASARRPACWWPASCSSGSSGCRGRCSSPRCSTSVVGVLTIGARGLSRRERSAGRRRAVAARPPSACADRPRPPVSCALLLGELRHRGRVLHLRDRLDPDAVAGARQRDALVRADAVGVHPRARVGAFWIHRRADALRRSGAHAGHRAVGHGRARGRHAAAVRRLVRLDGGAARRVCPIGPGLRRVHHRALLRSASWSCCRRRSAPA